MSIFVSSNLIIIIFILCLVLSSYFISKLQLSATTFDSLSRNSPLDGLRGILALSVFVHHFFITFIWKTTGEWDHPQSNVLDNFGAIPVSYFFLITGYLFLNKIKQNEVDWKKLFKSRIRRIAPLYYFVATFVIIFTLLSVNIHDYSVSQIFKWLKGWIIFNGKSLGDFQSTIIIAGVNWTLIYEWGFYFSLPLLHAIYHKKINNKKYFYITLIIFIIIFLDTKRSHYLLFILSILSIIYKDKIKILVEKKSNLLNIIIPSLVLISFIFTTHFSTIQKCLTATIFAFIANGYDFKGILKNKGLKVLGDISYSTYLLHGLVLYIAFTIFNIYNFDNRIFKYYSIFPVIFLIVLAVSFLSYKYIEKPFLKR